MAEYTNPAIKSDEFQINALLLDFIAASENT